MEGIRLWFMELLQGDRKSERAGTGCERQLVESATSGSELRDSGGERVTENGGREIC